MIDGKWPFSSCFVGCVFILSVRSDFHMTDSLSIAVNAFACRVLTSFSVDETLLSR